jgi:regulator of extracellular matrix RemA (YlzA/DUF370 family)
MISHYQAKRNENKELPDRVVDAKNGRRMKNTFLVDTNVVVREVGKDVTIMKRMVNQNLERSVVGMEHL